MKRERRLQLLADRAGERWSRRVHDRMAERDPQVRERKRLLEEEAYNLFQRIMAIAPLDPMIEAIRNAPEDDDEEED